MKVVSGAEAARACGVNKSAIYRAHKQGRLPAAGYTSLQKPLFDIAVARELFGDRRPDAAVSVCPECGRPFSESFDQEIVASINRAIKAYAAVVAETDF